MYFLCICQVLRGKTKYTTPYNLSMIVPSRASDFCEIESREPPWMTVQVPGVFLSERIRLPSHASVPSVPAVTRGVIPAMYEDQGIAGFRALRLLAPTARFKYETQRRTMANKLRYLLVLDFEATCGEKGFPQDQVEIIEFPTIVYDLHEKKEVERFHEYVRPVIQPQLTEFCTQLTGITQVSSAPRPTRSTKLLTHVPSTGNSRQRRTFPTCLGSVQNLSTKTKPMG